MQAFLNGKHSNTVKQKSKKSEHSVENAMPWVEKYRPRKVDDVVFQDEIVAVLKKVLEGADLPNLLFYGPPGTGKTSAAIALCRQLFKNADTFHDRVLELNASDERGINIVRSKVKDFARRAVTSSLPDGSSIAGLRVIILDEADSMTGAAQAALRRTMERESRTTRFFLICNYISRIIDPLTSRCAKFRFKSLPLENQKERIKYICNHENVDVDDDAITELIELCTGDLRKSITYLQSLSSSRKKLTPVQVRQLSGAVPDDVVSRFLTVTKSASFDDLVKNVENIKREGYGAYQLICQLFNLLLENEELCDVPKAVIFDKLGQCELRLLDGADECLQLLDLASVIQSQFRLIT